MRRKKRDHGAAGTRLVVEEREEQASEHQETCRRGSTAGNVRPSREGRTTWIDRIDGVARVDLWRVSRARVVEQPDPLVSTSETIRDESVTSRWRGPDGVRYNPRRRCSVLRRRVVIEGEKRKGGEKLWRGGSGLMRKSPDGKNEGRDGQNVEPGRGTVVGQSDGALFNKTALLNIY